MCIRDSAKALAQQVGRRAQCEEVERNAGDKFVGVQQDGEEDEDQRQPQRASDRPVSYTHLDVYKRQTYRLSLLSTKRPKGRLM